METEIKKLLFEIQAKRAEESEQQDAIEGNDELNGAISQNRQKAIDAFTAIRSAFDDFD